MTADATLAHDTIAERMLALRHDGRVRLDDEEIAALAYALQVAPPGEVFLFGSRVAPERRGGDIDILLLAEAPPFDTSRTIATRFFSRCEETIDVVVIDPARATPEQQDFLARITRVALCP